MRLRLVRFNETKIMIDKKQLIEDLLECVNKATDTQTAMTGMTMCAILMNEVIEKQLTLIDVVVPKETLCETCNKLDEITITLCKECYLESWD